MRKQNKRESSHNDDSHEKSLMKESIIVIALANLATQKLVANWLCSERIGTCCNGAQGYNARHGQAYRKMRAENGILRYSCSTSGKYYLTE